MSTFTAHDFPGFYTPYFSLLTFPVAGIVAISTKFFCYRRFSSNQNRPDFSDVIFAIFGSFLAGMFILFLAGNLTEMLPTINNISLSRALESFIENLISINLPTLIAVTFSTACVISIVSEFIVLRFLTSDDKVENLFIISPIANFASYIVQAIIVWAWVTWIW
jgi:uncharacterized membrane-anchored protein